MSVGCAAAMLSYFLTATLLTALTHAYLAWRLRCGAGPGSRLWRIAAALLLFNTLLLPGCMVLTLRAPAWAADWAVPLGHLTFFDVGLCLLWFVGMVARDAVWMVLVLGRRLLRPQAAAPADGARRAALLHTLNLAVAAVAGGASAIGYGIALAQPVVRRVRVPCAQAPDLPGAGALRVVHLSDLHVGPTIRRAYVQKMVDTVNALAADVIVITGDLIDGFVNQLREQVAPLSQLRARHGVYVVTGNHEYYYRADEWIAALRALGLRVLTDAHASFEHAGARVLLVGLSDPAAARNAPDGSRGERLSALLATAPAATLRILLTHRPADAQLASEQRIDLQLSGHLHGGQFFPLTLLVRWLEPFVAGLYRVRDLWRYVNRGAGYWGPPNRLGARQEITLLELVRA
jgi:predicted MPP superfamily phosphohydrolase